MMDKSQRLTQTSSFAEKHKKRLVERIQFRIRAMKKMAHFRKITEQKLRRTKAVRDQCTLNSIDRFILRHGKKLQKMQIELHDLRNVVLERPIEWKKPNGVGATAASTPSSTRISSGAMIILAAKSLLPKNRKVVVMKHRQKTVVDSPLARSNSCINNNYNNRPELGTLVRMNSFYL